MKTKGSKKMVTPVNRDAYYRNRELWPAHVEKLYHTSYAAMAQSFYMHRSGEIDGSYLPNVPGIGVIS